jgi:uncharacterized membrane protein YoaK (UPF0700 family)
MTLALTGGMLDAIVFLTHGHVFANAMTGNVVLLGTAALAGDWPQVGRHTVPLCAFLCGILAAKAFRNLPERHAISLGLVFEIVALAMAGALPESFPQPGFVAIVAFAAAFQVANFRRVRRFSYNSTFITGNLRDMAEGAFDALRPDGNPTDRRRGATQARDLGAVCLCFLGGVLAGAWLGPHLLNRALWCALPLLIVVAILSFRSRRYLAPS